MAYSHSRLRKTLALVRMLTGLVFVLTGAFKISDLQFAKTQFPNFLDAAIQGGAAEWFRPVLEWFVSIGPARVGVMIGFVELFIGIGLVLGLAVRPAALVGMLYSICLFLATWNEVSSNAAGMLTSTEHQFLSVFPFVVFLLLGVGHAGETWGLGSVYHRQRARKWEREQAAPQPEVAAEDESETEPGSFEEFVEQEERSRDNGEHAWSVAEDSAASN